MPLNPAAKAVFFDAAGTLFHLPRGVGFHYAEVAQRFGVNLDADELGRAFRAVWKAMPGRRAGETARADDDRGWWRELVGRVLDRCRAESASLDRDRYFTELYARFAEPGVWELFPEVREVLDALHGRFTLGIISNFDGRLRPILQDLGVLGTFQHIVISSEVGMEKPDERIFRKALASAGVEAGEALHAGDDPEADWQGAEQSGLRAFRLSRPENSLRDLLAALEKR